VRENFAAGPVSGATLPVRRFNTHEDADRNLDSLRDAADGALNELFFLFSAVPTPSRSVKSAIPQQIRAALEC
jgi:hypothetical protein